MKEILLKNKYLIILWIICILGLLLFVGHYAGILIDFGREVYYPEQILSGKVLYKDIFNIYGPLSYQLNALWCGIFGTNLSTFYAVGAFLSLWAVSGVYLISSKFLSKFLSFCIGIFTCVIGIASVSIFNFHFPYSWAVMYGLCGFLFSLYFLVSYIETEKSQDLCISALLAGFCVTSKYDFLLYAVLILFFVLKNKDWKALLCFFAFPLISFGILFLQGLNFHDLINSLQTIKNMAQSKTLTYFYQNSGIYFHPKIFITNTILFVCFALPFGGMIWGGKFFGKNKFVSVTICLISLWLLSKMYTPEIVLGFLPLFLLIFALASWRKFDVKSAVLTFAVLAASAKVFWLLIIQSYGSYYVSVLLIGVFTILFKYLNKDLEKFAGIFVLALSLLIFSDNFGNLQVTQSKIETSRGVVYTGAKFANGSNELIKYLGEKTKPSDRVVIFPEGMMINFLAERKSDDFYNSLLPLYAESLGESSFVKHFTSDMPEYFVFNNLDMSDYYFKYICQDYGLEFCGFVKLNYTLDEVIDGDLRYLVFKRKD